MNKPTIAEVADAVVDELNDPARNWAQAFVAERKWLPRPQSDKLRQMQCTVMTGESTQELRQRGIRQRGHEIMLVFRKMVDPDNTAAIDSLAAFVESVADYFGADTQNGAGARKIAGTEAIVMGVSVDPIVAPDELDDNRRFFSIVKLAVTEIAAVVPLADEEGDEDGDGALGIDIQEIISTSPPFGGVGEVSSQTSELTPISAGLLVFVLQIFQKSGRADVSVKFTSSATGTMPMTLDANVDLPGDPSMGKMKIYSVPVPNGPGSITVDLGGDTAYLTGDVFNITGLHQGVKNAVNIQNDTSGEPEVPTTSTTTNEAVIAGFMMRTADKTWEWRNGYTGCHDYDDDFFDPDYVNYRATAGYRFAGQAGQFNAALDLITPSEWAGIAVTYK